jgi:hypothetical protein
MAKDHEQFDLFKPRHMIGIDHFKALKKELGGENSNSPIPADDDSESRRWGGSRFVAYARGQKR